MDNLVAGVLAIVIAHVVGGCSPHEGQSCMGNVGTCTSTHDALWCVNRRFVRLSCHGPNACTMANDHVACDQSLATVHDRCLPAETGRAACSLDHASLLRCNGTEALRVTDCEGPRHCASQPSRVTPGTTQVFCDESAVSAGDPCEGNDDACSLDHASLMNCQQGHWRAQAECAGPNHCRVDGEQVRCDQRTGVAGSSCAAEDGLTCLAGVKGGFLVCRDHVLVSGGRCTEGGGCQSEGNQVRCPGLIESEVGSPCLVAAGCSLDRSQVLRCDRGTFVLWGTCAAGQICNGQGIVVHCEDPDDE